LISKILKEQNKLDEYIKEIKKSIMGIIKTSELRGGPNINPIIISKKEHKEMISNDEINVAKEALSDHMILKGYNDYWSNTLN
jgi:hypothetical protein